jgi:single-strand DNA-binding protein
MSANITLAGRLARDVEVKEFNGKQVAKFSIAIGSKNKDGKEHTDWYQCSVWGKTGEFVAKYFAKGSWIMVSGDLRMRAYDNKGTPACSGDISVYSASFAGPKVERPIDVATFGDPGGKPQDGHAPTADANEDSSIHF